MKTLNQILETLRKVLMGCLFILVIIIGSGETPLDFPWYLELGRLLLALLILWLITQLYDSESK